MSDPDHTNTDGVVNMKPLVFILATANFMIGMGAFVIIGILNPIAADLSLTTSEAGALMTSYAFAYAILSPVLVSATGRIGRRRVLTFALLIFAGAAALSAAAPNILVLHGARILAAVGAGMVTPVAAAVIAGLAPPDRQARALAAIFFGLSLAQVLGVPAGSWLAYTFGWRMAFWTVVALTVPTALGIWLVVPAGLKFAPVTLADLGQALRTPVQMITVSFTGFFLGTLYILFTYVAPLLTESMGLGRDGITITLAIAGVGAIFGTLLGGQLTDRIGPIRTLTILCIAQIVMLPFFSYLPVPFWVLLAVVVVWNTFGWSMMPPQQVRLISLSPTTASVLLALNAAAIYVGSAVGSAIGGWVISVWGLNALGFAASLAMVSALGILFLGEAMRRANP